MSFYYIVRNVLKDIKSKGISFDEKYCFLPSNKKISISKDKNRDPKFEF